MSVDVYVYQADLCCDECGTGIKEQLEKDNPSIAQWAAEGFVDSDDYPDGPHADGGGEADSPQHCSTCGRFLENPLTEVGERFVIETLGKYLREGDEDLGDSFLANEVVNRLSADDQISVELLDRYIEWSKRYDYVLAAEAQRRANHGPKP